MNPTTPKLNVAKIIVLTLLGLAICYLGFSIVTIAIGYQVNPGKSRSTIDSLYRKDAEYVKAHPKSAGLFKEADEKYGSKETWKITDFSCTGLWNAPCYFKAATVRKGRPYLESGTLAGSGLVNYQISEKR